MARQRLPADVRKDLMASPRERPRQTRRRIAGERTRPFAGGPAESPPSTPATPVAPAPAPAEEAPAEGPQVLRPTTDTEPARATEATEEPLAAARLADRRAEDQAGEQPEEEPEDRPAGTAALGPGRGLTLPWLAGDDDTRPGPANWVLAVLAGLLVAALALDGFVVWREVSHRQAEEESARAMHSAVVQAPSVAEKAATALLSYRYDQLPEDLAQARQYLTDDYAPNYVRTIRRLVAGSAEDLKVTVRANVLASGVSDASPARADVLLFVNQTTISPTEAPKTALNRVVFTMVPRDGGWKVDEIKAF
jgi:Mce-associated membrane protein